MGMPIKLEYGILTNGSGRLYIFCDLVIQIAKPLKNIMVVRVTMKAGIPNLATDKPLIKPMNMPTKTMPVTPAVMASNDPDQMPVSELIRYPPTTLVTAIMEVTERSIPPVSMT